MQVAEHFAKRRWPARIGSLYYSFHCMYLYIQRQERRFEYLYKSGEFEAGVWISLTSITDRLHKHWSDADENGSIAHDSRYKELMTEIAESEGARDSMARDLMD